MTWYRNKENTVFVNVNINDLNSTITDVFLLINQFLKTDNE